MVDSASASALLVHFVNINPIDVFHHSAVISFSLQLTKTHFCVPLHVNDAGSFTRVTLCYSDPQQKPSLFAHVIASGFTEQYKASNSKGSWKLISRRIALLGERGLNYLLKPLGNRA